MIVLEEIIKKIEGEFILYKFNKIGTFEKDDIGYNEYLDDEVVNISIENGKISIALHYTN